MRTSVPFRTSTPCAASQVARPLRERERLHPPVDLREHAAARLGAQHRLELAYPAGRHLLEPAFETERGKVAKDAGVRVELLRIERDEQETRIVQLELDS